MFNLNFDWLNALKQSTQLITGMFLFFLGLLILHNFQVIELAESGVFSLNSIKIYTLLFACLTFTTLIGHAIEFHKDSIREQKVNNKLNLRKDERATLLKEHERAVLERLNYLSRDEVRYIADCLRRNQQAFTGYVFHGPLSNMQARGIISSPGGTHNQDQYPFFIVDFVWKELLSRKDEFIAKDDEFKRKEDAEKRAKRRF